MIPNGAKVLWLKEGTKVPDFTRSLHGNLSAVPWTAESLPQTNYGINLDGDYLVVDFDCEHEDRHKVEESLPVTWTQRTGRTDAVGMHYLYRVPKGFVGSGKRILNGKDGRKIADVKAKGYIVGPGSVVAGNTYKMVTPVEPTDAPPWLLNFVQEKTIAQTSEDIGRQGIPNGEHDEFLFKMASWLRGQAGLSEGAVQKILRKGPLNVLQDVDESRPYEDTDLARIARSAGRYEALNTLSDSTVTEWKSLAEINTRQDVTAWHLYRFVPKNELVLKYGPGGIGKSSWASWLCKEVVKTGGKFGFAGVEEPFLRFGIRANMSAGPEGLDVERVIDIGNDWLFPRDSERLREKLIEYPLDVVYFDSIYNHFEPIEGLNMAERTRACLSPLAAIAQDLKVTIIGTFHENKAGDFLGSVEMINVARVVLQAERPKGKRYKLTVKKTNFIEPGYGLCFDGEPMECKSLDGIPWMEVGPDGQLLPQEMFVITEYGKTSGDEGETFELDEIKQSSEEIVRGILQDEPTISRYKLAEMLDWTEKKARYWLDKVRSEK